MSEYNIKVELEKKTYVFLCPEDQDIISAAKASGIDYQVVAVREYVQAAPQW